MAVVTTYTFTPAVAGRLTVHINYDAQRTSTGVNWGGGSATYVRGRPYVTQDGVTVYGAERGTTDVRASYSLSLTTDVAAGLPVDCGLDAYMSGLVSGSFWSVNVRVELIKR